LTLPGNWKGILRQRKKHVGCAGFKTGDTFALYRGIRKQLVEYSAGWFFMRKE
jgi:hypothetical protein